MFFLKWAVGLSPNVLIKINSFVISKVHTIYDIKVQTICQNQPYQTTNNETNFSHRYNIAAIAAIKWSYFKLLYSGNLNIFLCFNENASTH